jgi:hypothetical protein
MSRPFLDQMHAAAAVLRRLGLTSARGKHGQRGAVLTASAVVAAGLAVAGVVAAGVLAGARAGTVAADRSATAFGGSVAGGSGPGLAAPAGAAARLEGPESSGPARGGGPAMSTTHPRATSGTPARTRSSSHSQPASRSQAPRTSCRTVAHIGDSTSVDLISSATLPDPAQRLWAAYAGVGVQHLRISASGGRSIVEEMPGQANGYVVASAWRSAGYRGCWVFALGTNDAANVSAGSNVGLQARIDRMMSVAHGEPVLWVNTQTELSAGPWAEAHERRWDDTLAQALARYPNMRIFNWARVAQPGWFLPDGIHYNRAGCAARARAIASALARAFPLHGHGASRIVPPTSTATLAP